MAKTSKAYRRAVLAESTQAAQDVLIKWGFAQSSPKKRAALQAFEIVKAGLSDAKNGGAMWHGEDGGKAVLNLTAQEAAAFEVVAAYWKRAVRSQADRNKVANATQTAPK